MNEPLILVAVIRKPHGVAGELSADSYTYDNRRFKKLKTVTVRKENGEVSELTLLSTRETVKGILLKFKEITDRDTAELYREAQVLIPESETLPPPKGKAYYHEYPGMNVVDADSKEVIGTVRQHLEMPAGNILVLTMRDGSERLMTMAGEEFVGVDRETRTVTVRLLEEL